MDDDPKPDMLSSVEMDVLVSILLEGDNTPSNIARNTDRHKTSVSERLADLEDKQLVKSKGGGVWTLTLRGAHMAQVIISHREENGEDPRF